VVWSNYIDYRLNHIFVLNANDDEVTDFMITLVGPTHLDDSSASPKKLQDDVFIDGTISPEEKVNVTFMDRSGGFWVQFSLEEGEIFTGDDTIEINIVYEFRSYFAWWPDADEEGGDISDMPSWATGMYLGDMTWNRSYDDSTDVGYNSSHPEIVALAQDIVGDETNAYEIAKLIFLWMDENIEYDEEAGELKTVSETLAAGKGDCDDQATLYIALARAAGLPAWMQMGMLDTGNGWENHAWVQLHIPGVGNVTIDPSNDQFLINSPNRLATYTDQGVAGWMFDFYNHILFWTVGDAPTFHTAVTLTMDSKEASAGTVTVPFPQIA